MKMDLELILIKKKAFNFYHKAAKLGDKVGQFNTANMYKHGVGVEKNVEQALYWYGQAAQQGLLKDVKRYLFCLIYYCTIIEKHYHLIILLFCFVKLVYCNKI
jgi:TPR repeat protein